MIEKIKKILITLLLFCNGLGANNDEQLWQSATELYRIKNYQNAITSLLSIKNQSAAVFILLSNCYLNINQPVIAKMYEEKAFIYGSFLQKRLLLKKQYQKENNSFSYPLLRSGRDALFSFCLSLPILFLQFLLFLFVFLLLFYSTKHTFLSILSIIMIFVLGTCCIYKNKMYAPRGIALIDTAVKNFPERNAPIVEQVNAGAIVQYTEQKNGFYKLKEPYGWVQIEDIATII